MEMARRLEKLEKSLLQERDNANNLRRKLAEKQTEYDEKMKTISVVEAEVTKCKVMDLDCGLHVQLVS